MDAIEMSGNEHSGSFLPKSFDTCLSNLSPLITFWRSPSLTSVVMPQVCRTWFSSENEVHPLSRLWARNQDMQKRGSPIRFLIVSMHSLNFYFFLVMIVFMQDLWVLCSVSSVWSLVLGVKVQYYANVIWFLSSIIQVKTFTYSRWWLKKNIYGFLCLISSVAIVSIIASRFKVTNKGVSLAA